MADTLRVGVIGTGRIGVLHARNLAGKIPGVRLEAVSDVVGAAAEKCAAELGIASATTDHRRILDRKDIDAVVICSSTDTHAADDRRGGRGRQAHLLREADRPRPGAHRRGAGRGGEGRA